MLKVGKEKKITPTNKGYISIPAMPRFMSPPQYAQFEAGFS